MRKRNFHGSVPIFVLNVQLFGQIGSVLSENYMFIESHTVFMTNQVVACPRCGKHINFSIVELTADKEVTFVQESKIKETNDRTVHETECPEGHSFWYAAKDIEPLSA
jgi:hypothetical protein